MAKNTSAMGIYEDRSTVADAVDVLSRAGFRATDIAILSSENRGSKDFAHKRRNKALEGAATGAAVGAAVGALLGWLASTQSVAIMGLASLVAAGTVLAVLGSAGAGGILGWIVGFMAGLHVSEYVAKRYAGRVRRGGVLVSVHCDSQTWCDKAKKTLRDTGARDVSSASESPADYGTTDRPTERAPRAAMDDGEAALNSRAEYDSHESPR